ncbi:sentrin-specific protease 6-like [Pseudorasbora parva]|uniref:sentrin-specific protease 6-like n=1 Tax=Pseudorasbora parva TaxID=51549 RepID=UPI00351E20E9
MVRPLRQDRKIKLKPLKGNAIGLNLLRMRTILTDQSDSMVSTKSNAQPVTRYFEQPFKRFNYALQSSWRKPLTNGLFVDASSNADKETRDTLADSLMDTEYEDILSSVDTAAFVVHKKSTFKEFIDDSSPKKQLQRKYRMRDEFGNVTRRVKNPTAKKDMSPQRPNSLTLNIRCFKVGTLTKTFRRSDALTPQCTLAVDYIEIANEGRIEASDVIACEWCTVQKLPALFLQTTPEICLQLQVQLDMFEDDSSVWCDCQSRNEKEKYVVLIFENELTLPVEITLEEIFTEMGKRNNISCFPVKLSFEEANLRLKTHNCAQKQEIAILQPEEDELPVMSQIALLQFEDDELPAKCQQALLPFSSTPDARQCEIATLSISDSDEDDLIELPSSAKQEIKKLVVYPPPPAKGGLTITEEDLNCLEEGEFLNDVILDFYLRYLVCEQQEKEDATKYHVFSSFFFKHLTQEDHKRLPGTTGLSYV